MFSFELLYFLLYLYRNSIQRNIDCLIICLLIYLSISLERAGILTYWFCLQEGWTCKMNNVALFKPPSSLRPPTSRAGEDEGGWRPWTWHRAGDSGATAGPWYLSERGSSVLDYQPPTRLQLHPLSCVVNASTLKTIKWHEIGVFGLTAGLRD